MYRSGMFLRFLALLGVGMAASTSFAQEPASAYPSKSVKVVVGFAAGTGSDLIARQAAAQLQAQLGSTFVVENMTGASGAIAQRSVARATPDGYTLLWTSAGPLTLAPAVNSKVGFDPIKDYAPIGGAAIFPMVLVTAPSFPASNVKELVELAKKKPGEINYASSGIGLTAHMATEALAHQAGVKFTHVPYKGSVLAVPDLITGRIGFMFETPVVAIPLIKDGKLKPLAVGTQTRYSGLPDVPTFAESGLPGFSASSWMILVAPAGTPQPIVEKLSVALKKAVDTPDMRAALAKMQVEPMPMTAAETRAFVKSELDRWIETAKSASIKLD